MTLDFCPRCAEVTDNVEKLGGIICARCRTVKRRAVRLDFIMRPDEDATAFLEPLDVYDPTEEDTLP